MRKKRKKTKPTQKQFWQANFKIVIIDLIYDFIARKIRMIY